MTVLGSLPTGWRALGLALGAGLVTLLTIGVPTELIVTPFFSRMTPTRPQDYVIFGLTVLLAAALGASYALPAACPLPEGRVMAGGLLSFLAVGCPVCNKVVVLLLGSAGAFSYFEPVQPALGLAALALLGSALVVRLRAVRRAAGGDTPTRAGER